MKLFNKHNRKNSKPSLVTNENGFDMRNDEGIMNWKWDSIQKIVAYKEDLYTSDEVYLHIEFEKNAINISESIAGWNIFIESLSNRFPEIDRKWEHEILIPPYKRNETEIYNKKNVC